MSNLIKHQFINLADNGVKVIDNNERKAGRIIGMTDEEPKETGYEGEGKMPEASEFVPLVFDEDGLSEKEKVDRILEENSRNNMVEEAMKEAQRLIDASKEQCDNMLNDASEIIDQRMQQGYEEGKARGYEDGINEAKMRIELREAELEESLRAQREEMTNYLDMVEKKYVDILIGLIKKIAGIALDTKEDILLYLIKSAISDMDKSTNYNIRVSSQDLYEIETKKDEILEAVGDQVSINFIEESDLKNGDCIIETEFQMVDCSFETQINTLIEDLRLLS